MAKHGTDYNKSTDAPDSRGVQYEDVRMYKSKAIKEQILKELVKPSHKISKNVNDLTFYKTSEVKKVNGNMFRFLQKLSSIL